MEVSLGLHCSSLEFFLRIFVSTVELIMIRQIPKQHGCTLALAYHYAGSGDQHTWYLKQWGPCVMQSPSSFSKLLKGLTSEQIMPSAPVQEALSYVWLCSCTMPKDKSSFSVLGLPETTELHSIRLEEAYGHPVQHPYFCNHTGKFSGCKLWILSRWSLSLHLHYLNAFGVKKVNMESRRLTWPVWRRARILPAIQCPRGLTPVYIYRLTCSYSII